MYSRRFYDAVILGSISVMVTVFFSGTSFWIGVLAGSCGVGIAIKQAYEAGREE